MADITERIYPVLGLPADRAPATLKPYVEAGFGAVAVAYWVDGDGMFCHRWAMQKDGVAVGRRVDVQGNRTMASRLGRPTDADGAAVRVMTDKIMIATGDKDFLNGSCDQRRFIPMVPSGTVTLLPIPSSKKSQSFVAFEQGLLAKIAASLGISYDLLSADYRAQDRLTLKSERKKGRAYRLLRYGRCYRQEKRAARLLVEACPSFIERRHIIDEAHRLRCRDVLYMFQRNSFDGFMAAANALGGHLIITKPA